MANYESELDAAAEAIKGARRLLIGAGAGMGVDSGLPDFRGPEGFWRAYPPYEELGLHFQDMANPAQFDRDPELAWGFYGHRLELYRTTEPHEGFSILRKWAEDGRDAHVFTSNVDGQFQKAGFDEECVFEVHGSIHWLQEIAGMGDVWSADEVNVEVDTETMRAKPPLPKSPEGFLARPNILMFGDYGFSDRRHHIQSHYYADWLVESEGQPFVAIEMGAGSAIPTVRFECSTRVQELDGTLIRINPREPEGPEGTISLPMGAADALREIDRRLQ